MSIYFRILLGLMEVNDAFNALIWVLPEARVPLGTFNSNGLYIYINILYYIHTHTHIYTMIIIRMKYEKNWRGLAARIIGSNQPEYLDLYIARRSSAGLQG